MTNKQMCDSLRRAVESDTPDALAKILRCCEQLDRSRQKGCDMTNTHTADSSAITVFPTTEHAKKPKHQLVKWSVTAAAMVAMAFGTWFGFEYYTVDSVIDFDVNPSIELKVNRAEKVLSAAPLNADAEAFLDGMNLKSVDLDVAVNALIGSMLKSGYVSERKNSILISVENADSARGENLQRRLSNEVSNLLDAYSVGGAVLSQTVSEDERLQALAGEHHVSLGKAALVDLLVSQDARLKFADIAALPINDINLLIAGRQNDMRGVSSNGQASTAAYIGEAKAKSVALKDAGVSESSVLYTKNKLDYDDGRMVYEVEFHTVDAEYDYEIDAVTGQIVGRDVDREPVQSDAVVSGGNAATDIGEAKAKSIALSHAGVKESEMTFIKAKVDRDDGRRVYDIEFICGNTAYGYEVDAATGSILEHDRDIENDTASPPQQPDTKPSGGPQAGTAQPSGPNGIGEEKAKSIALGHAGLAESQVSRLRVKLERDDGRRTYDVEFKNGNIEYEYEIDAATGTILEWDSDYED